MIPIDARIISTKRSVEVFAFVGQFISITRKNSASGTFGGVEVWPKTAESVKLAPCDAKKGIFFFFFFLCIGHPFLLGFLSP